MKKMVFKNPAGLTAEVTVPDKLDEDLINVLFTAILGSLTAITYLENEEYKRHFLLRFTSGIGDQVKSLIHSCQLSTRISETPDNDKAIIENLLGSLHKRETDEGKDV